ncbi:dodecin domain-containing protein [Candidatus Sumerlaeota bacterium]|nr:dodecin domain-containing protein [Candidatus Sumerlaeota bacterium]
MSDHVFRKIEMTGTSTKSQDEAIQNAIAKAAKSVRNMRWFEVVESRGSIINGAVAQWQVTIKIGYAISEQ